MCPTKLDYHNSVVSVLPTSPKIEKKTRYLIFEGTNQTCFNSSDLGQILWQSTKSYIANNAMDNSTKNYSYKKITKQALTTDTLLIMQLN